MLLTRVDSAEVVCLIKHCVPPYLILETRTEFVQRRKWNEDEDKVEKEKITYFVVLESEVTIS